MKIMELNTKEYEELIKKGLVEEEKKIPEKLVEPIASEYTYDYAKKICHKINEIIDYLDYLKNKGE